MNLLKTQKRQPYKVVELFSGCGGLALGLHNAGLNCDAVPVNLGYHLGCCIISMLNNNYDLDTMDII